MKVEYGSKDFTRALLVMVSDLLLNSCHKKQENKAVKYVKYSAVISEIRL